MQNADLPLTVNFLIKQFLCNVPIKEICWKSLQSISEELQQHIIQNTTLSDRVLKYPISTNYQKAFLKTLIQHLEKQGSVIHDSLYEEYGRLVALPCNNNAFFKHYSLEQGNKNIILKESIHIISEGTTGLRTWQASLALSEWILSNALSFKNKIVLELGSGIGLTGLTIILNCSPKSLYLTDCHPSVLKTLCDNIKLNTPQTTEEDKLCLLKAHVNCCTLSVLDLPWEEISPKFCQKLGRIDKIVAADVVYDKSIFNPLVSAVGNLFEHCGVDQFILSCTERNSETLDDFLVLIRNKYQVDAIEVPEQKNFLWTDEPSVKMFNITKNNY